MKIARPYYIAMTDFKPCNSKTFCIFPWIHMHILPQGSVVPCCAVPVNSTPIGNVNDNSIEEIWNNEKFKDIRAKMLRGEKVDYCDVCYQLEDNNIYSLRNKANSDFKHHFDLINETEDDGHLNTFYLAYIDFRFSNVCNLRCKMCCPELSSSFARDYEKLNDETIEEHKTYAFKNFKKILKTLEENIDKIEEVYFAGGEPLLMNEQYQLLNLLIKHQKFDVRIRYNSNLTILTHKDWDILSLWRKFKKIEVSASLDAFGERAEYIRKGTNWKRIEENLRRIKSEAPNVYIRITCTLGLMNSHHLPEFHNYMVEKKFIGVNDISFNPIITPYYYSLQSLTPSHKKIVEQKYKEQIIKLMIARAPKELMEKYLAVIEFMNNEPQECALSTFHNVTRKLDTIQNTNFEDTFPEFSDFFPHDI